jgi:hypothetical protein
MLHRYGISTVLLCCAFTIPAALWAIKPAPLPVLPAMIGVDGVAPATAQLFPADPRWLIVYLRPECRPCDTLLQLVKKQDQSPALARRMVIVVGGGTTLQLQKLKAQFPTLAAARWYTANEKGMRTALKLAGSPVVLGVERRFLRWSINGIPKNPEVVRSAMVNWAGR